MINNQPQIAYYRVSTQRQGVSGLGLDAQRDAVIRFLGRKPDYEFIEIESGTLKRANMRFELAIALKKVKEVDGRLVIAKLDRLARNVHFVSGLLESKVNFVCCDNPNVIPMVIQILSVVAEYEAVQISQRTKDALAAKKARGFTLGHPKGMKLVDRIKDIQNGVITEERWKEERQRLRFEKPNLKGFTPKDSVALIKKLSDEGMKVRDIRDKLNADGHTTVQNAKWNLTMIYALIDKYEIEKGVRLEKGFVGVGVGGYIEDGIDFEKELLGEFVKNWKPAIDEVNKKFWSDKGELACVLDGDGINYGEFEAELIEGV